MLCKALRRARHAVLLGLALVATGSLGCLVPTPSPCIYQSLSVGDPQSPFVTPASNTSFTKDDVAAHYLFQAPLEYASHTATTISCVDAREDGHVLGSPGGDFAEFAMALHVYFKQVEGISFTEADNRAAQNQLYTIFTAYVADNMSPERPFYYHTDDTHMKNMYAAVGQAGVSPTPHILPNSEPEDDAVAEIWYEQWAEPDFQGCSHIRLMMQNPDDYGLDSNFIPQALLKSYLRYWWSHPPGTAGRDRLSTMFKLGKLDGHAVTVVNPVGSCSGYSPIVTANTAGSTVFVYHPVAVQDFRAQVVVPWFKKFDPRVDEAAFLAALNNLAKRQLGAILRLLSPANNIPIYNVSVNGTTAVNSAGAAAATSGSSNPSSVYYSSSTENNFFYGDTRAIQIQGKILSDSAIAGLALGEFFGGVVLSALVLTFIIYVILKRRPSLLSTQHAATAGESYNSKAYQNVPTQIQMGTTTV